MEKNRLSPALLFISLLILPSPILNAYGVSYQMRAMIVFLFDLYILTKNHFFVSKRSLKYLFFVLLMGAITAFGNGGLKFAILFYCFIFYSYLINNSDDRSISDFVDIATKFIFVLEIGAFIGFVYFICGGRILFSFQNPDGRWNCLYLTTFTNSQVGRFIRPAGIYDEPGAFAFFIVCIIALRIKYKKDVKTTLKVMFLGSITFSLAYFISVFFLYFAIRNMVSKKAKYTMDACLIIVSPIIFYLFFDIINTVILSRFTIDQTSKKLQGDNRSSQIVNSIKCMKEYGFLFGYYHHIDESIIRNRFGTITENPLTPMSRFGLFNSMLYTIFYLLGALLIFSPEVFFVIAILLLFMQRPYYDALGYTGFFSIFLNIFIKEFSKKYKNIVKLNREVLND